jgi:hypothetical protein
MKVTIVMKLFGLLCIVAILGKMRVITEGATNRLKLQKYSSPIPAWTMDKVKMMAQGMTADQIKKKILYKLGLTSNAPDNNYKYYTTEIDYKTTDRSALGKKIDAASKKVTDLESQKNAAKTPTDKAKITLKYNAAMTDWRNLNDQNAKLNKSIDDLKKSRDLVEKDIRTLASNKLLVQTYINQLKKPSPSSTVKPAGNVSTKSSAAGGASLGSGSGIMQPVPGYEKYKFKGCWMIGNDTAYPVLSKMAVSGVSNVSDCAKRVSNLNLSTLAYDGKGMCEGGDTEYQTKTPAECYNTYGQGKSWAVYSTK